MQVCVGPVIVITDYMLSGECGLKLDHIKLKSVGAEPIKTRSQCDSRVNCLHASTGPMVEHSLCFWGRYVLIFLYCAQVSYRYMFSESCNGNAITFCRSENVKS